jgi:hypothetical protein
MLMYLEVFQEEINTIHPLASSSGLQNLRLEMGSNINITSFPREEGLHHH